ncbi:hypothetical protein V8D89_009474 [Ganoderma adspersum]
MDSSVPLTPSLITSRIKEALACGLIAMVLSTLVYGITVLQAYIYFRSSAQGSVAFLFILDTATLILGVDALFEYVVTDFGEMWLLLRLPRALAFENWITHFVGALTQCFFAYRIWALSRGNILLVITITILALLSLVVCVHLYTNPDFFSLASREMLCLVGAGNGSSVLCDIIITAALLYYLNSKRTGFKRTNSIINRLIIYAVNRGTLTAICQAGVFVSFVAFPARLFHFPFDLLSGKLYCNTLLAMLNAQKTMRTDGDNVMEVDSYILNPGGRRHMSTTNMTGLGKPMDRMSNNSTPTRVDVVDISDTGKVKIIQNNARLVDRRPPSPWLPSGTDVAVLKKIDHLPKQREGHLAEDSVRIVQYCADRVKVTFDRDSAIVEKDNAKHALAVTASETHAVVVARTLPLRSWTRA